jgi:hypothetical protein
MLIKPFELITQDETEEKSLREKNIKRAHRDFYIYDEKFSNRSSFEFDNKLFAGVVQVVKLLVKGMPDEPNCFYDRDKSDRTTFVKAIYIYNAFMNDKIIDIEERFKKAVLRPVIGITSAYTDTKLCIPSMIREYSAVDNQFGISIYNFSSRSFMSILCDPISNEGRFIDTSRLDITDPRFNYVKYHRNNDHSESCDIPLDFLGKDLVRNGETNVRTYYSYFRNNHTFSEENMLNISREIYGGGNKFRFQREGSIGGLVPYQEARILMASDLIDKRRALETLIIDITKASAFSLFECFTMQYETGKISGFRSVKPPFKQYHVNFMQEKMVYLHTEFSKLCDKVSELFGRLIILLHINDVEHVVRCIFLDEKTSTNKEVTIRKTKLECINDYITETIYGKKESLRIRRFKDEHDLDVLNYYSHQSKEKNYLFNGAM